MFNNKIVALLAEASDIVLGEFLDCEIGEEHDWDHPEVNTFRNLLKDEKITFQFVDRYGGEDQGPDYWSVYSFSDDMQVVFIQFQGWYASYEGSSYEEFFEVTPVEKTITVFEKK